MNQKRAKAMRRMAEQLTKPRGMQAHAYKEMGQNSRIVDDGFDLKGNPKKKVVQITAPITVAADTTRGQYRAIKRMVKQAYGVKA